MVWEPMLAISASDGLRFMTPAQSHAEGYGRQCTGAQAGIKRRSSGKRLKTQGIETDIQRAARPVSNWDDRPADSEWSTGIGAGFL